MKSEIIIRPPFSKIMKSGRVVLERGESVGEHVTKNREELIIVLRGRAEIWTQQKNGDFSFYYLNPGKVLFIESDTLHDVTNIFEETLEYIYIIALY